MEFSSFFFTTSNAGACVVSGKMSNIVCLLGVAVRLQQRSIVRCKLPSLLSLSGAESRDFQFCQDLN